MSKDIQRIFYDVTQLIHWQGELTGIPRVMNELAIRLHEDEAIDATFISWVKEVEAFCEIDFDHSVLNRGSGIKYIQQESIGQEGATIAHSRLHKIRSNSHLRKAIKLGIRYLSKVNLSIADRAEKTAYRAAAISYKRVDFKPGDSLFIPWGEWWDPKFINILKSVNSHKKVDIIHILHDITPVAVPQFAGHSTDSFPVYCREILPICRLVLANSHYTKKDAIRWLEKEGLNIPRFEVFRLGDDFKVAKGVRPHEESFTKSKLKGGDYILCVGTIEARKNHTLLYYVYKMAASKGVDLPKIVIAGRIGWGVEQVYNMMTTDPEVNDKFVFLHNASDEELSWLYDHTLHTVFPSFYEGWGIPIAESVSRGVACLCSNTSSMVEIAEGNVEHASPFSPDEYYEGIQRLLDPKNLRKARSKAAQYKIHTWDDSYGQIREHLQKLG